MTGSEYNIRICRDAAEAQATILRRVALDEMEASPQIVAGLRRIFGRDLTPAEAVEEIVGDVRRRGDAALTEWMERIDGVRMASFEVSAAEREEALAGVPSELVEALRLAAGRIEAFLGRVDS